MNNFKKRFKFICIILSVLLIFEMGPCSISAYARHADGSGDMHDGDPVGPGDPGDTPTDPEPGDIPPDNPSDDDDNTEPVYFDTGEYGYSQTDISIPARGMSLEIKRTYRSQREFNGRFGYGWFFNFYIQIKKLSNNNMLILDGETGRKNEFTYDGTDVYIPPAGIFDVLQKNPDGTYTLEKPNATRYNFDINGNLSSIVDRNQNQLTFVYEEEKLPINGTSKYFVNQTYGLIAYDYMLTAIVDTVGRQIDFTYNDDGRLDTITDFTGRVWQYTYDEYDNDNLISVTTPATIDYPEGLTTSYGYDADHNLETITDAKGQIYLTSHYDAEDRVDWQIFGEGTTNLSYDPENNKTTIIDWKDFVTEWSYNDNGNPTQRIDYTASLRPDDPVSFITNYEYNSDSKLTRITYPKGNGTKYTFDESSPDVGARGNLLEIRKKEDMAQDDLDDDLLTSFTYEPNFNFVKTVTSPKGDTITYIYDYELSAEDPNYGQAGNLVGIIYPEVAEGIPDAHFSYNTYGQIETVTDPNDIITKYEYYPDTGYLRKIIQDYDGLNAATELIYDSVGNIDTVTNARGNVVDFDYNPLNQLTKITSPAPFNYQTKYTYDENGNLESMQRQANDDATEWQITSYAYTILDQLETITNSLGEITTFGYDENRNRISIQDAELNATIYEYDERDLLWKTTDALGNVTEYAYDENRNLKEIKDALLNVTIYTYDGFNRLESTTYADTSTESYTYDANSNLATKTDAKLQTIVYDYDALNRPDLKTYPDLLTVDYVYDIGSRLTDAIDSNGTLHYDYDDLNRITQTTNYELLTTNYEYDLVGNRTELTYPDSTYITYEYDELNHLTSIGSTGSPSLEPSRAKSRDKNPESSIIASYTYDTLSRRTKRNLLNDTSTVYAYDDANRLTHISNRKNINLNLNPQGPIFNIQPNQQVDPRLPLRIAPGYNNIIEEQQEKQFSPFEIISSFKYAYDNAGNRLYRIDRHANNEGEVYDYDDIYQLRNVKYSVEDPQLESQSPGSSSFETQTTYDLDAVGNRESIDIDGENIDYTPNELNQYADVAGTIYSYDANGNLESDGINTYEYDFENRLISATNNQLQTTNYSYDPFGRRIAKDVDGVVTRYLYDGAQVIAEYDSDDNLITKYTYGIGIDEVLTSIKHPESSIYYYHYDGLGSVSDITDSNGDLVESYNYDIYGAVTIRDAEGVVLSQSAINNPYLFTGRRLDKETGLYYYRVRHYSPSLGRFLQRDPIGYYGGINLYTYVSNNPINWIDPFGLDKGDGGDPGEPGEPPEPGEPGEPPEPGGPGEPGWPEKPGFPFPKPDIPFCGGAYDWYGGYDKKVRDFLDDFFNNEPGPTWDPSRSDEFLKELLEGVSSVAGQPSGNPVIDELLLILQMLNQVVNGGE